MFESFIYALRSLKTLQSKSKHLNIQMFAKLIDKLMQRKSKELSQKAGFRIKIVFQN